MVCSMFAWEGVKKCKIFIYAFLQMLRGLFLSFSGFVWQVISTLEQVMSITNGSRLQISSLAQSAWRNLHKENNHIYLLLCPRQIQRSSFLFREFSSLVVPVSKSFVRAMTLPNPLAMQIKPCISSKTFQSVPNSRSQDLPKFTASNLTS